MRHNAACCALALILASSSSARGDEFLSIKLSGLPSQLTFPFDEGSNRVLTVRVRGGVAAAVWIALAPRAKARALLTRTGQTEYQINLADPGLYRLLRKARTWQFKVFARSKRSGKVFASIGIRYTPSPRVTASSSPSAASATA